MTPDGWHPHEPDYLPVSYSDDDIASLRLERLHLVGDYLIGLLSNGHYVCIPFSVVEGPVEIRRPARYLWRIGADRRAVVWGTQGAELGHLELGAVLRHPDVRIGVASPPWPLL